VIQVSLFNGPLNKSPQPIGFFRLQLLPNRFPGLPDAASRHINPNASAPSRVQQFERGGNSIMSGSSNGKKPVRLDEYVPHLVSYSSAPE
jgi:hypothetical protein